LRTYPGVLTLAMLSETARREACAALRPDDAVFRVAVSDID
jgi:hypothetical protein